MIGNDHVDLSSRARTARGSPLLLSMHRAQLVQHQCLVVVQSAHDRSQYIHVVAQDADFG